MSSYSKPTQELVDKAIALMASPQHCRIFFGKLENPEWVRPLMEKACFESPPEPVKAEGGVMHPSWPPGEYLARMAPVAPDRVFEAVTPIRTSNARVIQNVAQAALAMPAPKAAELSKVIIEAILNEVWIDIYRNQAAELTVKLANEGEMAASIALADVLLELREHKQRSLGHAPAARMDGHSYSQLLPEIILGLTAADVRRGLGWSCNLLRRAVELGQSPEVRKEYADLSYIWRPGIEDHPQNHGHSLVDPIVTAVRDAAEWAVRNQRLALADVVEFLGTYPKLIFARIALHLVRLFADLAPELARERMLKREYFDDYQYRHEYAMLLRDRFSALPATDQAVILAWIEAGPDRKETQEILRASLGEKLTEEHVERRIKAWQRDRLSWFHGSLSEEWQARYAELVAAVGEPKHPDLVGWVEVGRTGEEPPKTAAELAAMPTPDLVSFLRTWRPDPRDELAPSLTGLAGQLAVAAQSDLGRFSAEARAFAGLHPTYASRLLREFSTALRNNRLISFEPVVDLCLDVAGRPVGLEAEHHVEGDPLDSDQSWEYARSAVADLIRAMCDHGAPTALQRKMWSCLLPLEGSPDRSYIVGEPQGDIRTETWLDHACNNPRAQVIEAVIRYAIWVKDQSAKEEVPMLQRPGDLSAIPEAKEVLERHLAPECIESPAVHSAYGTHFPALSWLDPPWASGHLDAIFALEGHRRQCGWAAWNSYLVANRIHEQVFGILKGKYSAAVDQLDGALTGQGAQFNPLHDLAEHLVVLCGRGTIGIEDQDGLLRRFFTNASPPIRGHAIQTVGRSLVEADQLPPGLAGRFKGLWDWYWRAFGEGRPDADPAQFVDFGWWLVCGKFDIEWCLDRLLEVCKIAPLVEPESDLIGKLAAIADGHPARVASCVSHMVRADTTGWRVMGWREELVGILRALLRAADEQARRVSADLIEHLGRRGNLEYGDLLKEK